MRSLILMAVSRTKFQKSVRVLQEAKDRLKEKMQIYR